MKIAIAGASGFIGTNLIHKLLTSTGHEVVALSRSEFQATQERISSRKVNLYSLLECEEALEGCDVAIYLVHSMSPSARLAQGEFQDFDFILADNFAKAAEKCQLKQIIYVGGIIPKLESLSLHLESRLEVEQVLCAHKTPVTTLRCGLVIGKDGSSFRIVERLIDRLPILGLPTWTRTELQAVYIDDLVSIIAKAIDSQPQADGSYDVGAPDKIEYRDLLVSVSKIKGKNNIFIPIRFLTTGLSKFWVRLITRVPKGLVYPLVDSLRHRMVVSESRKLPDGLTVEYTSLQSAMEQSLRTDPTPDLGMRKVNRALQGKGSLVQSVQRLPCPLNWSMKDVAKYYMVWVPRFLWPFFKIVPDGDDLEFYFRFFKKPLLVLTLSHERTFEGRELFYITGGMLNSPHPKARIEFREGCDREYLIVAIHSFRPSLPWFVYKFTQAPLHKFVMWRFGVELSKIADNKKAAIQEQRAKESP